MIAVTTFERFVLPKVPGAPGPAVRDAIVKAAQEFCKLARIWQETMPAFDAIAGQSTYAIPTPNYGVAHGIEWLRYDGTVLDPIAAHDIDRDFPEWWDRTGQPECYLQLDADVVQLVVTPESNVGGGIVLRATYMPEDFADQVPTALFTQFRETMIHGAAYYLLEDPQKPWTNPELAGYHRQQFRSGIGSADAVIVRGFRGAPLRTRSRMRVN